VAYILIFLTLAASWLLGFDVSLPSILMGVGIAIDVMLATVSKFRDEDLSFRNWTLPIMGTHIGFPAIGYYGFWGAVLALPFLGPTFGIIGAVFVALFIYEVFSDWVGHEPIFGISAFVGGLFGFEEDDARRMVAIMAVSWDALWSGPAKAAQAVAGNWTDFQVACSFAIAGLVVATAAQISLKLAFTLRKQKFENAEKMAGFISFGKLLETSVISGFGILSLSQGFNWGLNLWQSIVFAAIIMVGLFGFFAKNISESSLEEAEEAIAG
jgi:hypothetical protein